jgi:hypothetical protein
MEKAGKARIEAAKAIAEAHGAQVLGWKDKPGQEAISLQGDGDKLVALRKVMEKEGWHLWPVEEAAEGFFMDFGMQPPPPDWARKNALSTEAAEPSLPYASPTYSYRGLNEYFMWNLIWAWVLAGLLFLFLYRRLPDLFLSKQVLFLLFVFLFGLSGAAVAFFHWTEVYAGKNGLIVRNGFWNILSRENLDISLSDIKKAKIYATSTGRGKSISMIVTLKSGKAIELFLPKRARGELLSFINGRIPH